MAKQGKEEKKYQSVNEVDIVGKLVSIEVKDLTTKKGVPMKIIDFEVQTSKHEKHKATMMAMEPNKDSSKFQKSQWKAAETIESDYVTQENVEDEESEHYEGKANIVAIKGNFDANVYKDKKDNVVIRPQVRASFINRLDNASVEDFGASFRLGGFLHSNPKPVVERDSDGDEVETGKHVIEDFRVIDYTGKAVPFKLYGGDTGKMNAGEWMEENLEKGMTMVFSGNYVNHFEVIETPIGDQSGGFGEQMVDTRRVYTNELQVVGGLTPLNHEDFDETDSGDRLKVVFPDVMEESLKAWKQFEAERVADQEERNKPSGKAKEGFGETKKSNKSTKKKKAQVPDDIDDDDLPF